LLLQLLIDTATSTVTILHCSDDECNTNQNRLKFLLLSHNNNNTIQLNTSSTSRFPSSYLPSVTIRRLSGRRRRQHRRDVHENEHTEDTLTTIQTTRSIETSTKNAGINISTLS
jgi:hypothetical protein